MLQLLRAQRLFDLSICAVLTQGIHGPDGGGDPAKDGELQDQADKSRDRSANSEEGEPGEDKGNQQAHQSSLHCGRQTDG
jgi:hypothetical protein